MQLAIYWLFNCSEKNDAASATALAVLHLAPDGMNRPFGCQTLQDEPLALLPAPQPERPCEPPECCVLPVQIPALYLRLRWQLESALAGYVEKPRNQSAAILANLEMAAQDSEPDVRSLGSQDARGKHADQTLFLNQVFLVKF
jgi:hypothetical protein